MASLLIASFAVCVAAVGSCGAQSPLESSNAAATFSVGGRQIVLPAPAANLVEVGADGRQKWLEPLVVKSNRLIAGFLPPNDLPMLRAGQAAPNALSQYAMVQIGRRMEDKACTADAFRTLVGLADKRLIDDSFLDQTERDANAELASIRSSIAKLNVDRPVALGRLFARQDAAGYGMVALASAGKVEAKMAVATIYTRVRERLIYCYLYVECTDAESVRRLDATAEKWAAAILEANP